VQDSIASTASYGYGKEVMKGTANLAAGMVSS